MLDLLLDRTTVITLAVIGGLISIVSSWLNSRGATSEKTILVLTKLSYVFMGASMVLFVFAGLLSANE